MSRLFIIGATGGVGHRLLPLLIKQGHTVTALHRKAEQADILKEQGALPVLGDLMDLEKADYLKLLKGHDIIIFSAGAAGSGMDRTNRIDGDAPVFVSEAALELGIKRIYLVSAFPEAGRTKGLGEGFENYMRVKKEADAYLVQTPLDWVILRPGTLVHEDGDNKVSLDYALCYNTVKRGNVAAVLAKLIDTPEISRKILELTDGSSTVDSAVKRVKDQL